MWNAFGDHHKHFRKAEEELQQKKIAKPEKTNLRKLLLFWKKFAIFLERSAKKIVKEN